MMMMGESESEGVRIVVKKKKRGDAVSESSRRMRQAVKGTNGRIFSRVMHERRQKRPKGGRKEGNSSSHPGWAKGEDAFRTAHHISVQHPVNQPMNPSNQDLISGHSRITYSCPSPTRDLLSKLFQEWQGIAGKIRKDPANQKTSLLHRLMRNVGTSM